MTRAHQKHEIRRKFIRELCGAVVRSEKPMSHLRKHLQTDGEVKWAMRVLASETRKRGMS